MKIRVKVNNERESDITQNLFKILGKPKYVRSNMTFDKLPVFLGLWPDGDITYGYNENFDEITNLTFEDFINKLEHENNI